MTEQTETPDKTQVRFFCPYQQCDIYKYFFKKLRDEEIGPDINFSPEEKCPIVLDHSHLSPFFCDAIKVYNECRDNERDKLPGCSHIEILNKLELILKGT